MVRFKNRYIVFDITLGDKTDKPFPLNTTALHNAIQQKIQQLFGDFGVAAVKAGFTVKYCNIHTKLALVKARHGPHKMILKALPTINDVANRLVSIKILYVSSTLKHCFSFIKIFQQRKLEEVWYTLRTEMERKHMENALMTLTPAMKGFTYDIEKENKTL